MLRALSIRHFAIITAQELEFEPGFTAITGETGAGKSILIDALGLLLGNRADSGMIAEGQPAAELSATFELSGQTAEVSAWLNEQAMDDDDLLILRRIVPRSGSSRAWINGRSSTIGQLAELGQKLVEIHGQHEHQQLERPSVQRRLLDQQVSPKITASVQSAHSAWQDAQHCLDAFERDAGDSAQLELLNFQVAELNALQITEGEFEKLESDQERLSRQDEIRNGIVETQRLLTGDDQPGVQTMLREAMNQLAGIRQLDPDLDGIAAMLDEARINIDEAVASVERLDREDDSDQERLSVINQRLERALDLARKHRVDGKALPRLTLDLSARLERLENQDKERAELDTALQSARAHWHEAAEKLHRARTKVALDLAKTVNEHLKLLGMDQARIEFSVRHDSQATPREHGADQIQIQFAGNPGQTPKSLGRVASGGELSRISLALMIAARPDDGPMIRVFDEVDAGIGGQTASVVGQFLSEVADGGQAFCVTHLAQVAAAADHQLQVVKSSETSGVEITVKRLDQNQRREEIARMLSGSVSEKSREHAAELLSGS